MMVRERSLLLGNSLRLALDYLRFNDRHKKLQATASNCVFYFHAPVHQLFLTAFICFITRLRMSMRLWEILAYKE